jgi:hypothetical protein
MANETTTTTLTETVYAEYINPMFQGYAKHYSNPSQFFRPFASGNGSPTISVPRLDSNQGTPNDDGVAVDLEYNATEATDLSNVALSTSESNFSVSEYGIMRTVTDTSLEDSVNGAQLISTILKDAASILMTAANDDGCALFAGLSNSTGSTGVDLSIANVDDALYTLAERGIIGSLVGVLDNQQMRDFFAALQATGTSMAVYAGAADRLMAANVDGAQGRNEAGETLRYKGVTFHRSGLTDTANAGADVVGAIFLDGRDEANFDLVTFGQASKRPFRAETQRDASLRATEVVCTMRWGCGELQDTSGQKLVTDA